MQGQNKPAFYQAVHRYSKGFYLISLDYLSNCENDWQLINSVTIWFCHIGKLRQKHTKNTLCNLNFIGIYLEILIYQNIKTRGPMDSRSLTWVLVTRRGRLPQNLNPISPTPKSILGITKIITKTYQVTMFNQNILICTISMSNLFTEPMPSGVSMV